MAQPQRHPKTGVFRFRRVVPPDLRAVVGKTEELISLGTKDAAEARVRYAAVSAEVEARWANLRKAPQTLTEREAFALAAIVHDRWLDRHRDNPSELTGWRTDLYDQLWTEPARWDMDRPMEARMRDIAASVASPARGQEEWCVAQADLILSERGLRVDEVGRTKLARAVASAFQRASLTLPRAAQGEVILEALPAVDSLIVADGQSGGPSPIPPSPAGLAKHPGAAKPLSLTSLFEAWWQEAKAEHISKLPNCYHPPDSFFEP